MKKNILSILILLVSMVFAGAQSNQVAALAAVVSVNISTRPGVHIYAVTVPDQAAQFIQGAKRAGESDEDFVRRAFAYGANGLVRERQFAALASASISNQIAATQARLAADVAQTTQAALARQAALSNQLNVIKSQL